MSKYLTYEYRIYPNKKQKEFIFLNFQMCRYMYNTLLKEKVEIFHQFVKYSDYCANKNINVDEKKIFKISQIDKNKCYKRRVKGIQKYSLALCAELSHLNRAFENFYSGRAKFPKYKKRKDKNTYTTSNVNENIRIDRKNKIRLPKLGYVKAVLHRKVPDGALIKRAIVKENKTGKFYVSLVLEFVEEKEKSEIIQEPKVLGLDFKVGQICVTSDGNIPEFGRPYINSLEKLRIIEKKLGKKEKFSKNYWKLVRKIRVLHKKVSGKRKNFLHKLSKEISIKYDYIGIETISLKEIAKKLSTGVNVYETGFSNFVEMLKYKTLEKVIYVDKWFASSKLCSKCGNIKKKLKLEQRVYRCSKCGLVLDRDLNAAINIKHEAMRILLNGC